MRIAGRTLLAVLLLALIFGALGAAIGSPAHAPQREAGFHKPHPPLLSIDSAQASSATSFAGEWAAPAVTRITPRVRCAAPLAARSTHLAIASAAGPALDQRPPPPALLA